MAASATSEAPVTASSLRCRRAARARSRAAEAAERLEPEHRGARRTFRVPDPFQHELQVRRLDPPLAHRLVDGARAGAGRIDLPRCDLVEHALDERLLDLDVLARQLV